MCVCVSMSICVRASACVCVCVCVRVCVLHRRCEKMMTDPLTMHGEELRPAKTMLGFMYFF